MLPRTGHDCVRFQQNDYDEFVIQLSCTITILPFFAAPGMIRHYSYESFMYHVFFENEHFLFYLSVTVGGKVNPIQPGRIILQTCRVARTHTSLGPGLELGMDSFAHTR